MDEIQQVEKDWGRKSQHNLSLLQKYLRSSLLQNSTKQQMCRRWLEGVIQAASTGWQALLLKGQFVFLSSGSTLHCAECSLAAHEWRLRFKLQVSHECVSVSLSAFCQKLKVSMCCQVHILCLLSFMSMYCTFLLFKSFHSLSVLTNENNVSCFFFFWRCCLRDI